MLSSPDPAGKRKKKKSFHLPYVPTTLVFSFSSCPLVRIPRFRLPQSSPFVVLAHFFSLLAKTAFGCLFFGLFSRYFPFVYLPLST